MTVEEPEAGRTYLLSQRGEDSQQDAAVSADHEWPPARQILQPLGGHGAGQGVSGSHGLPEGQHTGLLIPLGAAYLGAVAGDGSGTDARTEAIIAVALGGAAVLVTVLVPKNRTTSDAPEPGPGPATPEAVAEQGHHAH